MVLSQKIRFYFVFYVVVLSTFRLSLACYSVVLFLDLLWLFIYVEAIYIGKTYLISQNIL